MRRALISVSDRTGLVDFARGLEGLGVQIVATKGTAALLEDAGIGVSRAEQITGFAEMLDGRVKTLHPKIHAAVLARRDVEADRQTLRQQGVIPIDLVCVNLYPFQETIATSGVAAEEAIEQIDIGGPALIRSAAKNHRYVTVVTGSGEYERVIAELRSHECATTLALRRRLAADAFAKTAEYDSVIAGWMCSTPEQRFPAVLGLTYRLSRLLSYGENPHQQAALYAEAATSQRGVVQAEVTGDTPLSYNNIHDAAAALELIRDLAALRPPRPAAAIIKHTNPCGVGVADTLVEAFRQAHKGDPLAAFGGILALSRRLEEATARCICEGRKFLQVVVAPGFEPKVKEMLCNRWKNVRLIAVGEVGAPAAPGSPGQSFKTIPGGLLAQEPDTAVADPARWRHAAGPAPDERLLEDAAFIWTVAKHLKSNAVAIGSEGRLLGAGAGHVDRVTACRNAVEKAGDGITDRAVAASDAFFAFPDAPAILIRAGVSLIVHPGGSKRDQETLDLCDKHDVTCLLTGIRHFRH